MEYIGLNTPTELNFTLYSNCVNITNPFFSFVVQNKDSNECFTFSQLDHSSAPYYYNSFTMSISTTMSGLTAGIIMANPGMYNYSIYEMGTSYSLNISSAVGLVESGILTIVGTVSPLNTNTQSDYNNAINVNQNLSFL